MQAHSAAPQPNEDFHSAAICLALKERDDRLQSLKAFAGKLAHDFRNALVPQLGYVALIKEQVGEESAVMPFALKLETASRKLESYLDAILLAVRPERRFTPKPCDFSDLVARGIDAWFKRLPADASIRVESNLAPSTLVGDEALWTNVVEQLLKNAQFGLAAGGTLEVLLRIRSLIQEQAAGLSLDGADLVQLTIRDNGFGMTEDVLRRACEPFFTTRPKGQAAGLGLTIAHSVARLHGGQLVLESEPDAGTTVTIWLPLRQERSGETRTPSSAPQRGATLAKVLLIEPDPMLLEVIKSCLRRISLEAVTAQDGHEGLKLFQRQQTEWRGVIIDVARPMAGEPEVWLKIRESSPSLPMVLIGSGAGSELDARMAQLESPRPIVMRKPFALKSLADAVSRLIAPDA